MRNWAGSLQSSTELTFSVPEYSLLPVQQFQFVYEIHLTPKGRPILELRDT